MDAHIKQLRRSCFYQLRRLRVIRHCLSRGSLLTLACAFICNRIDYCKRRPLWSYCMSSRSPTVRPERYGAPRPQHSKVLTHFAGYPWWYSLASSPVSLSVQNLYSRAKQHCRFFTTITTGTLPPCRHRVGSSASSICWPKRPLSSAVSHRELWLARFLNLRTATLEHTVSWNSTISWKLEPH